MTPLDDAARPGRPPQAGACAPGRFWSVSERERGVARGYRTLWEEAEPAALRGGDAPGPV